MKLILLTLVVMVLSGCATEQVWRDCEKISDSPKLFKKCVELK